VEVVVPLMASSAYRIRMRDAHHGRRMGAFWIRLSTE
jgi:hypothetical protein